MLGVAVPSYWVNPLINVATGFPGNCNDPRNELSPSDPRLGHLRINTSRFLGHEAQLGRPAVSGARSPSDRRPTRQQAPCGSSPVSDASGPGDRGLQRVRGEEHERQVEDRELSELALAGEPQRGEAQHVDQDAAKDGLERRERQLPHALDVAHAEASSPTGRRAQILTPWCAASPKSLCFATPQPQEPHQSPPNSPVSTTDYVRSYVCNYVRVQYRIDRNRPACGGRNLAMRVKWFRGSISILT
jgi:hypothetical protein